MIVTMQMPAGQTSVAYGAMTIHSDPDGTFGVPRYAVPELLAAGCTTVDEIDPVDVRAELAGATARALCAFYLPSRGIPPSGVGDSAARAAALAAFDAIGKPQQIPSMQFLNRLPDGVMASLAANPATLPLLISCAAAGMIDLTDTAVQSGINDLVPVFLTSEQAAVMLDH